MAGRRSPRGVLLGVAIAAGACSTFGASPSADSVDGGLDGAVVAAPAGDGASLDAGSSWVPCEARTLDAAHFCDDFDFVGRIDAKWQALTLDGGSIGDTDAAASGPRAFVAGLSPRTGDVRAQLQKERPPGLDVTVRNRIALAFSMRVDANPFPTTSASGYVHVAVIQFDDPSCATSGTQHQRQVEVSFSPKGGLYMATKGLLDLCTDAGDYMDESAHIDPGALLDPRFHQVRIEILRTPCPAQAIEGGSVRLTIDDTLPTCLPTGDPFGHANQLNVLLGLFGGGSGTWSTTAVSYDNVTLDLD